MLPPPAPGGEAPPIEVSMRERPQPQLLLADLPQPGEAVRLDDQEENDEPAEYHELEVGNRALGDVQAQVAVEKAHRDTQDDRQQRNEGTAQEGAERLKPRT